MEFGPDLPSVSEADWAATPASVKALVRALVDRLTLLETEVVALHLRVAELEDRLRANSTNSSRPPSTDPAGRSKAPAHAPSKRKRGAQKGHRRAVRALVPTSQVERVVPCKPQRCGCGEALAGDDPAPLRHQVFELPRKLVDITEYQLHALQCPRCGCVCRGELPPDAERTGYGPRFTALLAFLSTRLKGSVRDVAVFIHAVFQVPLATGTISKCQQRVSAALEAPVQAAHAVAQQQAVAHLDETGWRENKARAWLWVFATTLVTIVCIAARRSTAVARRLLGNFRGIVVSDRWVAYAHLPVGRRQLCWSHLRREWQRFVDRGGHDAQIGEGLQGATRKLFKWWHWLEQGRRERPWFVQQMRPVQWEVEHWLTMGELGASPKTAATCREILALREALWTFVTHAGVPPTNNFGEQQVRLAVVLRKIRYGTDSVRGSRFLERMLSTVQTLERQRRNVLDFLVEALLAHRAHVPAPSLIPAPSLRSGP